jgi:hypothetical protein
MDFLRCEQHTKERHGIVACASEILCDNANGRAMVVGVCGD